MTNYRKGEQFVCISCLEEVRYSFVSHLSEALRRKGINYVVMDVDSDDPLSKEWQTKVSVMILPGNCEPTKVWLDKFVKVLECQRNNHEVVVVVPVLYGDIPLHGEWLTALDLRCFSPVHQSRGECSDSILVEEIVRDIYKKLFYMERIGVYSKLLEIEKMVCSQPLGIRRVGIWGMPGIGKTTVAKAVFDQMSQHFDACCFIEDYEKAIQEKGLYRLLEEQLLEANPGSRGTITNLCLLRDILSRKRVLVVLDDVRYSRVAESFLDGFEFSPESLIIITSRDKMVFRLCQINQIYEVKGLNEKEALKLFLLSASIKDMGDQNLHELSIEVLNYAKGNPLAICIYGRELKGKINMSEMETAFHKLRQRPPLKIVDAFKISYDTLSDSEKNIFLDIACFFQGENVDYVKQLLEGCGFFPHVGIDVLVEKCLVTISENRVWMHNLTQDVGREIVTGDALQVESRSRVWESERVRDILEITGTEKIEGTLKMEDTEKIEGMFLDIENLSNFRTDVFDNMLNLRLLKLYRSSPSYREDSINSLPNELRLLHWEHYTEPFLPTYFDPMNLVEINMPFSELQKLWGGTKNLEKLKTIRLCHSTYLVDIEDILKAPNLEVVDLQGCTKLQSFPPTVQLLHLRVVNLSGCKKIKEIPEVSPNIETLRLQGTGIRKVPLSVVKSSDRVIANLLAELPGLSDALKRDSLSLVKAYSSSQDLGKLVRLELKDCSRLGSLPNMDNLGLLTVLNLEDCSNLKNIQGFPRNLKELYLSGTAVKKLPQLPPTLEILNAHNCASLKSIRLDSEHLPIHCTFSNCFNLSPEVVNGLLGKVLGNVNRVPRERPHELKEALAFSFCVPSLAKKVSTLDLQQGSSVMTRLDPSWTNTLVGFAMLVEVSFSKDYYHFGGFGISCVCRWKNREGRSHRIERNLHFLAAYGVRHSHMFVFYDAKMHPSTGEGNDTDVLGNLVVFEFVPVDNDNKRLDIRTVTRCGMYAINGNTEMSSPVLSSDKMESSGDQVEEELRVSYDGLEEMDKALFRYIACLLNDDDVDLLSPLTASVDVEIDSGLKELASKSLIRVSSSGEIVMHSSLQKMWKQILHNPSMLPSSSKDLKGDVDEKPSIVNPSSSRIWKYQVYLSFSWKDVRQSFVSHLVVAFKHKSIRTFEEDKMVRGKLIGPLLVQAIRESRISIVVLSKRYASSSWLLEELVEITKCMQELGQIVIPVFYDVDPMDVRKQTGEFGRHFRQISKGKTEDEKQQWQQALIDIEKIAGYHCSTWDDGAELIEKIVTGVSNKLNGTPSADLDGFVGINAHISKINPLLSLESEEVKVVGIWGPPGVGKTTIARYIYNKISSTFQRCAFIDILNAYKKRVHINDDVSRMYFKLLILSEITNQKDAQVYHLDGMKERVRDSKVLLILDGVDDLLALDAVAQRADWFGAGSRIIVTTKDLGLLKSLGISYIYKMDLDGDIESILTLGYDGLREADQDLFLHISCLFNHGSVEYLTSLLTRFFTDIKRGLRRLAEKSLIHISEHEIVTMHHWQQQLGRGIVRKECIDEPGRRRFLVDSLDICNVFAGNTGTSSVLGISLDMSEIKELVINERGFNGMNNLQFLKIYTNLGDKEIKVSLPHGLEYLSHKLTLLHWEGFPMTCLPSNFIPNHLVELTMVDSMLEKLWSGIQPLESLKCMNLRWSLELREIPNLSHAINLETLDLRGCSRLTELPSSIGHLHKLKDLDMERCILLEVLPTGINLESLYYLNLNGCSQLRSFPQISRSILDLYLDGTAIEEVPGWIENMHGLTTLSMTGCNKLKRISPNISKLKHLEEVDFSECKLLTEASWQNHPEEICTSLMRVNMSGNSFERLPDTWTSIQPKDIDLSNCRNLVSLPELPASLSILTANDCESLESLYGSFQQRQMSLQFINCYKLNHQARESILHSDCAYAVLPGGEVPAYFTHRVNGNLLTVSFHRNSLSRKILSFKACILVISRVCWSDFGVICGKDKKYFSLSTNLCSPSYNEHLIIFTFEFSSNGFSDHPVDLCYSDVQFDFFCHDHKKEFITIKKCGVKLLEVSPSPDDSMKRVKTEDDDMSGDANAEASRSRKQMRIT